MSYKTDGMNRFMGIMAHTASCRMKKGKPLSIDTAIRGLRSAKGLRDQEKIQTYLENVMACIYTEWQRLEDNLSERRLKETLP